MTDKLHNYKYQLKVDKDFSFISDEDIGEVKAENKPMVAPTASIEFSRKMTSDEDFYRWMKELDKVEPWKFPTMYYLRGDYLHELKNAWFSSRVQLDDRCEVVVKFDAHYLWLVCPRSNGWMWDFEIETMEFIDGEPHKVYVWTEF
jgi:hypothetical protein